MNTVRFLSSRARSKGPGQAGNARRLHRRKRSMELAEYGQAARSVPEGVEPEPRALTNLGTFRAYLVRYLRSHPEDPPGDDPAGAPASSRARRGSPWRSTPSPRTPTGPTTKRLQADLFDHMLAALPEFGLKRVPEPQRPGPGGCPQLTRDIRWSPTSIWPDRLPWSDCARRPSPPGAPSSGPPARPSGPEARLPGRQWRRARPERSRRWPRRLSIPRTGPPP